MTALTALMQAKRRWRYQWQRWDEAAEDGLDPRYFCVFGEGSTASEVGLGLGLDEADRTVTVSGSAASGTPPSRPVSSIIANSTALVNAIFARGTWALVWKFEDLGGDATNKRIAQLFPSAYTSVGPLLVYNLENSTTRGALTLSDESRSAICNIKPAAPPPTSGLVHLAAWSTGRRIYTGWSVTARPTRLSDFDADAVAWADVACPPLTWPDLGAYAHIAGRNLPNSRFYYLAAAPFNFIRSS